MIDDQGEELVFHILLALVSGVVGLLIATLRFRYERAWQIKHEHYRDILSKLDEIRHYARDAAGMAIPIGATLTDRDQNEINELISRNVGWLGRNVSATSLFIGEDATRAIEDYVLSAKGHHFDMAEDGPHEDSDWLEKMEFHSNAFGKHAELAEEASLKIVGIARLDLHGWKWISYLRAALTKAPRMS